MDIEERLAKLFAELRQLREDIGSLALPASMLSIAEAAERMGYHPSTVKRLVAEGDLAVVRHGSNGHPRIPVSEILRYQAEHLQRASPPSGQPPAPAKRATQRQPVKGYDAQAESAKLRAKLAARRKKRD